MKKDKDEKEKPIEQEEPEVKTMDGELGDGGDHRPKDPPKPPPE